MKFIKSNATTYRTTCGNFLIWKDQKYSTLKWVVRVKSGFNYKIAGYCGTVGAAKQLIAELANE